MDHSGNSTASLEALERPYQVFLIVLYSLTACFAFFSNLLAIVVLVKGKRCTRDLRKFLINLSVTDLLMAVFTIPFTYTNYMLGRWIFWSFGCAIVNFAQLTTITVSIYTLVAIAIDRYFAIAHPLRPSVDWFKTHRTLAVLLIWAFGITIGMSQLVISETSTFVHNNETFTSCGERWTPDQPAAQLYTIFIFVATFFLPILLMTVLYSSMLVRLYRYRLPPAPDEQQQQQQQQDKVNKPKRYSLFSRKPKTQSIQRDDIVGGGGEAVLNEEDVIEATKADAIETMPTTTDQSSDNNLATVTSNNRAMNEAEEEDNNNNNVLCTLLEKNATTAITLTATAATTTTTSTRAKQYSRGGRMLEDMLPPPPPTSSSSSEAVMELNTRRQLSSALTSDNNPKACCSSARTSIHYDSLHNQQSWKIICIRRNKVLKMLITIIGVFTLCWLPIQLFNLYVYFKPDILVIHSDKSGAKPWNYYAFVGTYFLAHWVSMAHSFMNPIILLLSKNFREDFCFLFQRFWNVYVIRKNCYVSSYSSKLYNNNSNNNNNIFANQHSATMHHHHQQQHQQPQSSSIDSGSGHHQHQRQQQQQSSSPDYRENGNVGGGGDIVYKNSNVHLDETLQIKTTII